MQIQREAVSDYLVKMAVPEETTLKVEARKRSYTEGVKVGLFLLLIGGVLKAAACDGNLYTIDQSVPLVLPGTLPIWSQLWTNLKTVFVRFAIFNVYKIVLRIYVFSAVSIWQQAILTGRKETSSKVCLSRIASKLRTAY